MTVHLSLAMAPYTLGEGVPTHLLLLVTLLLLLSEQRLLYN